MLGPTASLPLKRQEGLVFLRVLSRESFSCSFPLGTLEAIDSADASKLAMDRLVALATYLCGSEGPMVF